MREWKNIRIGFDGKRAVNNNTGLGNYSRLVIESLAEAMPEQEFKVYAPRRRDSDRLKRLLEMGNVEFRYPDRRGLKAMWRSFGITSQLRKEGITLYHGLSNELPLNIAGKGIATVVTIHDVIYRRLPYCYTAADRALYDLKYGHSCRTADRIIAVSERTKQDVMHYYGVDERRITVVYQGCDAQFRNRAGEEEKKRVRAKYGLPERYVIQVGTVEKRKNLENTIRGMAHLPEDVALVAVGRDRGYRKELDSIASGLGLGGRIYYLENADFRDFPALYGGALASAYPSRYEGFGIPVLEALESGVPVVAATGSCLEEAGGKAAFYADPESPRQIGEALAKATGRDDDVKRKIAEGLRHASRFGNENVAVETMKVYESLLREMREGG